MKENSAFFNAFAITNQEFNDLAIATKFKTRFRRLQAFDFIFCLLHTCSNNLMSFNNMALKLGSEGCKSVSKQTLHKAMTKKRFLLFIRIIFKKLLVAKLKNNRDTSLWKHTIFKRILVQDGTVVKLPKKLFSIYSGVANQFSQVANARIQYAFDLLNEEIVYFSIDSYSRNDISKAKCLQIKEGDLVLRGRGYFSYAEVTRLSSLKADFIYRYKNGVTYLDIITGKPIALLAMLKLNSSLDIKVRLMDENGPVIRLVANAVNEELANRRRQKLKKEAKFKPGEENLALLSWSIFITSIQEEKMNYKELYQLYSLRWRVEILFKSLKSNLSLDNIHNVSNNQLIFMIYAKLIMHVLIINFVYLPVRLIIKRKYNKELSILKLTAYLCERAGRIIEIIYELCNYEVTDEKIKLLSRYCCYEKRKRKNYDQFAQEIFLS